MYLIITYSIYYCIHNWDGFTIPKIKIKVILIKHLIYDTIEKGMIGSFTHFDLVIT